MVGTWLPSSTSPNAHFNNLPKTRLSVLFKWIFGLCVSYYGGVLLYCQFLFPGLSHLGDQLSRVQVQHLVAGCCRRKPPTDWVRPSHPALGHKHRSQILRYLDPVHLYLVSSFFILLKHQILHVLLGREVTSYFMQVTETLTGTGTNFRQWELHLLASVFTIFPLVIVKWGSLRHSRFSLSACGLHFVSSQLVHFQLFSLFFLVCSIQPKDKPSDVLSHDWFHC